MNRLEALRIGGGGLLSFTANPPAATAGPGLALPQFAFTIGIGANRGVGVLFDSPVLVVQDDDRTSLKRLIIPSGALQREQQWREAAEPAVLPTTNVSGPANSDVLYGPIRDRATALCLATRGVYIAMLAFPTLPYLVHYDVDKRKFQTHPLPSSDPIMVAFERPGRLYYILAASTELRSVELAP